LTEGEEGPTYSLPRRRTGGNAVKPSVSEN